MKIELNLKKHCIETAIKCLYNSLISEYFRNKGKNTELEEKIAILKKSLTSFDFPFLRTNHKELAGKSDARINLTDNDKNMPGITINGRLI